PMDRPDHFDQPDLQGNASRLLSIIQDSPVATCVFEGPQLIIALANEPAIANWGKGRSVIGKPLAKAIPELNGQNIISMLKHVYTTGEIVVDKASPIILEADGLLRTLYFDFTFKALLDERGSIYGVMETAINVTEEVHAKKALEESNNKLEFAIDAAELGTWDWNMETNSFSVNDRLKGWFLVPLDADIEPSQLRDLIAETDIARVLNTIARAFQRGGGGYLDCTFTLDYTFSRTNRIVCAKGKVWFDETGMPGRFNGTLQDITRETTARELELQQIEQIVTERTQELAKANQNLHRSNQELEQFAYVASHDLQEPVRKISTFTGLLERHLGSIPEKCIVYLNKIKTSTERMSTLIHDVLAYSQVGKTVDMYQDVDLTKVIDTLRQEYELVLEDKEAIIESKALPIVKADGFQMSLLFGNLLSNSLKYSRPDIRPVIDIRASELPQETAQELFGEHGNKRYYKILFRDNGIGFSPEYTKNVFQLFKRLHGKNQYEGTGIGLSICNKIVQAHQGIIHAEGSRPGSAIFTVILPDHQ
nr:hypothetical protein [Chitinophagaceae bacterium]